MVLARREGKKEKEGMKKVAAFGQQITTGDTLLTLFSGSSFTPRFLKLLVSH